MKIKYEHKEDLREAVAFKFHVDNDPEEIGLCIRMTGTDKAVWMYWNGATQVGVWTPEDADVLFYEGDTIEITF